MIAFSRLATFVFLILSLSFLVCASPNADGKHELLGRGDSCNKINDMLVDLRAQLDYHLGTCTDDDIGKTTNAIVAIGVIADVDAKIKTDIAAHIAAVVVIVVKILIKVSAKISLSVLAKICADIDVCLKALLVALNVCVQGVLGLSLKFIVDLTVLVFLKVKLGLCADVLGLLKL
ncbi:hypothetical protein RHS01_02270 [Rhizoctonia solani]|uniref:Transmembrane protein n=1 Tax=Rhizoctonia solani TaxID=456999 RepID=A0A8H7II53_9AGAM|nr:hypothetical protein RHS01_02270 [Rhizoctonia solani]